MKPVQRKSNELQVGDVVMSEQFAYGKYDSSLEAKPPQVGRTEPYASWVSAASNPTRTTGKTEGGKVETLMYDASDETRKGAKFVVVEFIGQKSGQSGHDPCNIHPGGKQIVIQRLKEDGSYNPEGEKLFFYPEDYIDSILEVLVVGKMVRTFVPAES